ncbi:unnamed protein product [Nesidiocoris tenuis]|uniref:PDZ domain-containing protein n=1 Tax=Nesidiocoris tenuis TaxID=355587 RepID=A0A6H5HBH4_9HEMI|nr:unnamed protein product [Nesidiocoris tenuis]
MEDTRFRPPRICDAVFTSKRYEAKIPELECHWSSSRICSFKGRLCVTPGGRFGPSDAAFIIGIRKWKAAPSLICVFGVPWLMIIYSSKNSSRSVSGSNSIRSGRMPLKRIGSTLGRGEVRSNVVNSFGKEFRNTYPGWKRLIRHDPNPNPLTAYKQWVNHQDYIVPRKIFQILQRLSTIFGRRCLFSIIFGFTYNRDLAVKKIRGCFYQVAERPRYLEKTASPRDLYPFNVDRRTCLGSGGGGGAEMGSNLSKRRSQSSGNLTSRSSGGKLPDDKYKLCGSLPNHLDLPNDNNNEVAAPAVAVVPAKGSYHHHKPHAPPPPVTVPAPVAAGRTEDLGYGSERSPDDPEPPFPACPVHHAHFLKKYPFINSRCTSPSAAGSIFSVTVKKGSGGLGLSVAGGDPWPGLIRIKRLFPHQPASHSGLLTSGDILLAASGVPLLGLTNYEFEILMEKVNGSLGFTLRKEDQSVLGHYVRALVREPALSDPRIRPGDKIVAGFHPVAGKEELVATGLSGNVPPPSEPVSMPPLSGHDPEESDGVGFSYRNPAYRSATTQPISKSMTAHEIQDNGCSEQDIPTAVEGTKSLLKWKGVILYGEEDGEEGDGGHSEGTSNTDLGHSDSVSSQHQPASVANRLEPADQDGDSDYQVTYL